MADDEQRMANKERKAQDNPPTTDGKPRAAIDNERRAAND